MAARDDLLPRIFFLSVQRLSLRDRTGWGPLVWWQRYAFQRRAADRTFFYRSDAEPFEKRLPIQRLRRVFRQLAQMVSAEASDRGLLAMVKTVAAHPMLSFFWDMPQDSALKLVETERLALLAVGAVVGIPKDDPLLVEMLDLGVAKRAAFGIPGQVGGHTDAMTVGRADLGVPFDSSAYFDQEALEVRFAQSRGQLELAGLVGLAQGRYILGAKDLAYDAVGQQEVSADGDPSPCRRPAAAGDEQVQVGVSTEVASPGVEACQDADGGAQVLGVGQELLERFGGAAKQEVGHDSLVAPPKRNERVGKGEDGMVVGAIQESRFLLFQPALRGQAAALGTTAVFAGVVVNFFDVPVGATSNMSAHLGGPAAHHRRHGLARMQRLWISMAVIVEMFAEYTAYCAFHTGWYPFLLTVSLSLSL